jgi:hypothetical protein
VLVERVERLGTVQDWMRAYAEINEFEEHLTRGGAIVVKFWLQISKAEQLARFEARERASFKRFKKITPELAQPQEVGCVRARPSATWSTGPAPRSRHGCWSRPRTALRAHQVLTTIVRAAEGSAARMSLVNGSYAAPAWLPGGHAQTIYPALQRRPEVPYRRQRVDTPDGDFVDLDWLDVPGAGQAAAPLVVLFHGLEGNSSSHYALALMLHLTAIGWRGVVPHFRGCSGEPNRLPRAAQRRLHRGRVDARDDPQAGTRGTAVRGRRFARRERAAQLARPRRASRR